MWMCGYNIETKVQALQGVDKNLPRWEKKHKSGQCEHDENFLNVVDTVQHEVLPDRQILNLCHKKKTRTVERQIPVPPSQ